MSQASIGVGRRANARRAAAAPRAVISQSWDRVRGHGVDPDRGSQPGQLPAEEIEHRRRCSPLTEVVPLLRDGLSSAAHSASHMMIIADDEGRVLWRDGDLTTRGSADRIGITQGSSWLEETAGTNAIGTTLATGRPTEVHSAEHFVHALRWTNCAAAPLRDPRDGRLLGAVDVTGPAATAHPATLALVTAVARVAEGELRARHWASVDSLRSVAAPLLARIHGRAVVVDPHGWTAAVTGMPPLDRVALPSTPQAGQLWLPTLGMCALEPLPGGWLVRPGPVDGEGAGPPSRVVLDVSRARAWTVAVSGPAGRWEQQLSPRHAELLLVLALHRAGRTAAELACDLFGDPSRTVTVRAELSRLRRTLAGVLAHRPYRFADEVDVELLGPQRPADLLPHSAAPAVVTARRVAAPVVWGPSRPPTG